MQYEGWYDECENSISLEVFSNMTSRQDQLIADNNHNRPIILKMIDMLPEVADKYGIRSKEYKRFKLKLLKAKLDYAATLLELNTIDFELYLEEEIQNEHSGETKA